MATASEALAVVREAVLAAAVKELAKAVAVAAAGGVAAAMAR